MNSGSQRMHQKKFVPVPDKHAKLMPTEIDREELSYIFLCAIDTVKHYEKISGLLPIRKAKAKYAFNRAEAIEILSKYAADGKLTRDKKRLLAAKKKNL